MPAAVTTMMKRGGVPVLSVAVVDRPTKTSGQWVEHFGAGAGFWNAMRLYPVRGLTIVVMSNSTRRYDFEPLFILLAAASWD